MVDAIPEYVKPESVELFERFKVFSRSELQSRMEIEYEIYAKTLNIEAKAMIDIATKQIVPAVIRYICNILYLLPRKDRGSPPLYRTSRQAVRIRPASPGLS